MIERVHLRNKISRSYFVPIYELVEGDVFKVLVLIRILVCASVLDLVGVQNHILGGQGYTRPLKIPESGTQALL